MKKKILALVIIVLIGLGFFLNSNQKQVSDNGLQKVKLAQFGQSKFLLYLPLYIAMEKGYFAEEGIDLELSFAGNDDQIFAAVMSGSADFGMGDPVFTAIAQEKGAGAKTVAMLITSLGLSGYTNNESVQEIKDEKDLEGLRLSSFPEPSTTYTLLSEIIRNNGLQNTEIVQASFGAQLALLEAGKVDIAVDLEPSVSIAEDKGYRVVFSLTPYTPKQAITGITVRQNTIDNKPEMVQKLVNGLQKSLSLMASDRDETIKIAKIVFPDLKEAVVENAVNRMMAQDMYPNSPIVIDEYWQQTLKTRMDAGDLEAIQPTDMAVDNSFAFKAFENLGK